MSSVNILVVDDEELQNRTLVNFLRKKGYNVHSALSYEEAISQIQRGHFDIALLDLRLGDKDGIELLNVLREKNPLIKGIIITAFGTIDAAVRSMKKGAVEFLTKPINLEELLSIIKKIEDEISINTFNEVKENKKGDIEKSGIVFKSEVMKKILLLALKAAKSMASILITGESGVGKEELARFIHRSSGRIGDFVAISCAAIPENLLESELFGYKKGAFTGANNDKKGMIEVADGGTLFLDEIGEMPPHLQAKLLRFLESGEYWKLGEERPKKANVRIISATNRNLEKMIKDGTFREDLFYRINTVSIHIPPLRERREDIIPLAEHFLKTFSKKMHKDIKGFTKEAKYYLISQTYKGNVRELKNMIERAVVLADKEYITPDMFENFEQSEDKILLRLSDVEREHIKKVLLMTDGNIKEAAEILGIHRNTLTKKIKEYFKDKNT